MSVRPSVQSRIAVSRSSDVLDDLDVVVFVLVAQRAADVAEDLMAARVPHRVDFGDLLRILPLAHRRVIVRQLLHAVGARACRDGCRRRARSSGARR